MTAKPRVDYLEFLFLVVKYHFRISSIDDIDRSTYLHIILLALRCVVLHREAMTQSFASVRILMTVGTDHLELGSWDAHSSGADGGDRPSLSSQKAYSLSPPGSEVCDVDVDADVTGRKIDMSMNRNCKADRDSSKEIVKCNSNEKKMDDIPSPRGAGYFMAAAASTILYGGAIPIPTVTAAGVTATATRSSSSSSEYPRNKGDVLLNFEDKVEQCDSHLESFALSVDRLKALIVKDLINLSLVMHEPELWQRLVTSVSYHGEGRVATAGVSVQPH